MKLVFVSNMLNHHQMSLCEELQKRFQQFQFVATEETKNIGYQKSHEEDFIIHYYKSDECASAEEAIQNADIVLFGACPDELIELRMRENKLSFLYSERFLKKGIWRRFIPQTRKKINNRIVKYKRNNIYVLCASAYLSYDLSLLGYPMDKCFKWGYFPEVKKYELEKLFNEKRKKEKPSILWVGRLIEWKHPEIAILLAEKLVQDEYDFKLNIVGDGIQKNKLLQMIEDKKLGGYVQLLGSMSSSEVRKCMEKADIFLATSDFYEGWGAVLNEAMNSGCAVVASHAIGAAPFLIKNKENGVLYKNGDLDELCQKVENLIENEKMRECYGEKAYLSIENIWNAEVAAQRFSIVAQMLMEKKKAREIYEEGPCSLAEKMKNDWYV